jgi:transcriptional regulator with XRE-family HTH domain
MGPDNEQRAIELRQQGLSRSQIAEALGLQSGGQALGRWLRGVPPPEWTKRPRAKDDLRERAVELRKQGWSYREIREELNVSKSSLSLWLRDVVLTEEQEQRLAQLRAIGQTRAARTIQARRLARQQATIEGARSQVQQITEGELFIAGVVAYWAEGSKPKLWRSGENVTFCNSDPGLILLFLRWLELMSISRDRAVCSLMIHESADVSHAMQFWLEATGLPAEQFRRPVLKTHKPKTNRKNVAEQYHGCLSVYVRRSTEFSRQITGWSLGLCDVLASL